MPNRFITHVTNLNDPTSDHTPVLLHIGAQPLLKQNRPTITPGITNWNTFRNILSKKTILNVKLKSSADIDSAINLLTNNIQNAAKDSSTQRPSKSLTNNLTPELRQLLAKKRRARSTWQRTHYPDDKTRYNMLSNKLKSLLKIHKNDSYKNYLQNLSLKNGSLWRKTKSILRIKEITPPLRRPHNSLATTDKEKADTLAEGLSSAFVPHSISPPPLHLETVAESLYSPLPMALPAKPTSPAEISGIIKKLANRKSPGHDLITNKVIKNLPAKTIIFLAHIYNATLRLSYFPSTWKSSVIVTILKPGKPPKHPSSYRPISLLQVLGKILEKILLKRLSHITTVNKNIPNFQFGFRTNHSRIHQLHRVTDTISTALETKKYCAGLFLDVAKAFDTVWHDGLLFKLKTLFPAPYYLILKSYLDNHTFKVHHNLEHSKQFPIAAGVPQGSDIAPFLYTIYTSDLPTSENTILGTYADDTAILSTATDHTTASRQLQTHIDILSQWFVKWRIKINETKSSLNTFSLRPHYCPPITMNNIMIPHSNEVKYLRLTWSSHLMNKRKKLNSRMHLLRPLLRSNLTLDIKILLYKTLIQPLWAYGVVVWGSAKKSNKRTIQAFQNICCRLITGAPWYVSNNIINSDIKIRSVNDTATLYYKRFHAKLLSNPNQLIKDLATPALPGNPTRRLKRNWCRDLKIL
uniref:Putative RNA-directed DNA polymerase n=1 Tax=Sipha flava TaxID=143950 RepID=A0A2S2Q352_9HEMI